MFSFYRASLTATYTFPTGSTGATVDLGAGHNYRYVNAANVYNKGYDQGVTDADARANPASTNYQTGYNQGVANADARTNPSSANYQAGYNAGKAAVSSLPISVSFSGYVSGTSGHGPDEATFPVYVTVGSSSYSFNASIRRDSNTVYYSQATGNDSRTITVTP